MSEEIGSLVVRIAADISDLSKGLEKAGTAIKTKLSAAADSSKVLLGGVVALGAGLGALGVKAVSMAADMEQSKVAFTTMLGSAEQADVFIKNLYDFAAKTPFEFTGLQESSRKLLAFGFQANQIIPMMTAIGNAVSGIGGGEAEISRVTLALGQMQAQGKVSAEEMMQLAELGIPAWQMLADKIGVDIPTAMKMAENGAVPAAQGIQALIDGMNQKFPGMMEQQSKTLSGMWSTIKDNLSMTLTTLGQKIVDTFDLKNKLQGAVEWLNKFSDLLKDEGISGAIDSLFSPEVQTAIVAIAGAITAALIPAFWGIATAAWAAMVPLLPFIAAGAAIAALAFVIYRNWEPIKNFFITTWDTLKAKIVEVWDKIKDNPIANLVAGPFINLVKAGIAIYQNWDTIKAKAIELWEKVKEIWTGIKTKWVEIKTSLAEGFENLKIKAGELWDKITDNPLLGLIAGPLVGLVAAGVAIYENWDLIKERAGELWDKIRESWENIYNKTTTIWDGIKKFLNNTWQSIYTWADQKWTGFKKMFLDVWEGIKTGLKGYVNNIISMINSLIDAFNTIQIEIPDWAPGGGKTFGINLPHVPYLAKGGIVTRPTLAMVGESGPEAVIPLSGAGALTTNYLIFNIYGASDAKNTADQIVKELRKRGVKLS